MKTKFLWFSILRPQNVSCCCSRYFIWYLGEFDRPIKPYFGAFEYRSELRTIEDGASFFRQKYRPPLHTMSLYMGGMGPYMTAPVRTCGCGVRHFLELTMCGKFKKGFHTHSLIERRSAEYFSKNIVKCGGCSNKRIFKMLQAVTQWKKTFIRVPLISFFEMGLETG